MNTFKNACWVVTVGSHGIRYVRGRFESKEEAQGFIDNHFDASDDAQYDYDPDRTMYLAPEK